MNMLKKNGVSGSFAMAWLVLPDLAAIFLERQADAKSSFQQVRDVIKEGTYCVYHGDRKHNPFLTSMALTESTLLITGCAVGVLIACCLFNRFCWSMFWTKSEMTGSRHRFFGLQDLLATEACIYAMYMVCFKKLMFLGMKWILWIVTISRVIYRKMDLRCSYSWLSKWNDKAERMVLLVFSRERTSSPLEVSIAITRWTPGPSKSEIYDNIWHITQPMWHICKEKQLYVFSGLLIQGFVATHVHLAWQRGSSHVGVLWLDEKA